MIQGFVAKEIFHISYRGEALDDSMSQVKRNSSKGGSKGFGSIFFGVFFFRFLTPSIIK